MDNQYAKSILTVALMAAFADGLKDERERESIRKLAEALGPKPASTWRPCIATSCSRCPTLPRS